MSAHPAQRSTSPATTLPLPLGRPGTSSFPTPNAKRPRPNPRGAVALKMRLRRVRQSSRRTNAPDPVPVSRADRHDLSRSGNRLPVGAAAKAGGRYPPPVRLGAPCRRVTCCASDNRWAAPAAETGRRDGDDLTANGTIGGQFLRWAVRAPPAGAPVPASPSLPSGWGRRTAEREAPPAEVEGRRRVRTGYRAASVSTLSLSFVTFGRWTTEARYRSRGITQPVGNACRMRNAPVDFGSASPAIPSLLVGDATRFAPNRPGAIFALPTTQWRRREVFEPHAIDLGNSERSAQDFPVRSRPWPTPPRDPS